MKTKKKYISKKNITRKNKKGGFCCKYEREHKNQSQENSIKFQSDKGCFGWARAQQKRYIKPGKDSALFRQLRLYKNQADLNVFKKVHLIVRTHAYKHMDSNLIGFDFVKKEEQPGGLKCYDNESLFRYISLAFKGFKQGAKQTYPYFLDDVTNMDKNSGVAHKPYTGLIDPHFITHPNVFHDQIVTLDKLREIYNKRLEVLTGNPLRINNRNIRKFVIFTEIPPIDKTSDEEMRDVRGMRRRGSECFPNTHPNVLEKLENTPMGIYTLFNYYKHDEPLPTYEEMDAFERKEVNCLLYTSPSPRD